MTKQFRLTVKGQVTIPKDVRDHLGIKPGEPVAFEREGDKVVVRKSDAPSRDERDFHARLEKARKCLPALDFGMMTDEFMALIRKPVPLPDLQ